MFIVISQFVLIYEQYTVHMCFILIKPLKMSYSKC